MVNAQTFDELVSGRRRGWGAASARLGLSLLELPYLAAVSIRNQFYDRVRHSAVRLPAKVISVGNLTLGGTGKTPMVAWLVRWFLRHPVRPAMVSRGYRKLADQNDEFLVLAHHFPHIPHVQDRDRVRAARRAIRDWRCQIIILDDGFQHRRLHRDLDLVLIDGTCPFGYARVFPRGLLRESARSLRRADAVALSRVDLVPADELEETRQKIRKLAPQAAFIETVHRPHDLLDASGHASSLECLVGQRVAGFCGIGNPRGFQETLRCLGCHLAGFRTWPDHYAYRPGDLTDLEAWLGGLGHLTAVLCTEKDLVKIRRLRLGGLPLWAVTIETHVVAGESQLEALLERCLPS
jgi:tetraacyldisaccharide 4'-kinase